MRRRGPDDEGAWRDDHLSLGFRRLSILDLSPAAHQPMRTSDGRGILVFNGEVYNFRALRQQLEREGVQFRSSSDTEVVLSALHRWGVAALARFDGMFALAFWDLDRRQLLLARDPVGIKPLYVLEHRLGLVFGSQYDQVVRHPWCERQRIDVQALGTFLRLGWVPPPEGLIHGTHMLEPGTALLVDTTGSRRTVTFRSFLDEAPSITARSEADELVDRSVRASVAAQLVSDVPVGVFLSGGIDSPLVASEARRSLPEVPSFTIGSDDPLHDESADAQRYATAIGTRHVARTLGPAVARAAVDELAHAFSEPFGDLSALPTLLVSGVARESVTVALSGDGGDELFWGYPRFSKVAGAAGWFRWPRVLRMAARQGLRAAPRRRPPAGVDFPSVGDWYLDAHAYVRRRSFAALAPAVAGQWRPPQAFRYDGPADARSILLWMRRNEWRHHLPMILLKVDRASMHHGLEVRVPLLGHEVDAVAERLDPSTCIGPTEGKLPLRAALRARVGPDVVTSGKRGFSAPVDRWLKRELRGPVEESLLDPLVFASDLLDRRAIARLYQRHLDGPQDHTKALWALLALQRWADHHLRPLPPASPRAVAPHPIDLP